MTTTKPRALRLFMPPVDQGKPSVGVRLTVTPAPFDPENFADRTGVCKTQRGKDAEVLDQMHRNTQWVMNEFSDMTGLAWDFVALRVLTELGPAGVVNSEFIFGEGAGALRDSLDDEGRAMLRDGLETIAQGISRWLWDEFSDCAGTWEGWADKLLQESIRDGEEGGTA